MSIDGPPKTHEKLRGMPSSYEDAVSSLKELRSIKKIKVHASMTLFDQNSHLIEETLDALKANIVGFKRSQLHLNQAFHSEHYYKNSKNSVTLNSFLPHEVTKKFSLISSPTDFLKYIYLKNLARYQRTKITPIPCSSMTSNVYISEHGDLFTCTIWNKKVGSLREQDFNLSKLMTSPNARSLKSQIDKKMCVNCWSPCEAFPSIIDNIEYFIK